MLLLFGFPPQKTCTTADPVIKTQQYKISFFGSNESCNWVLASPWALIQKKTPFPFTRTQSILRKFVNVFLFMLKCPFVFPAQIFASNKRCI